MCTVVCVLGCDVCTCVRCVWLRVYTCAMCVAVCPCLVPLQRELQQYCEENAIVWVQDPTNESDVYYRNRVRKVLRANQWLEPPTVHLIGSMQHIKRDMEQRGGLGQGLEGRGGGEGEDEVVVDMTSSSTLKVQVKCRVLAVHKQ